MLHSILISTSGFTGTCHSALHPYLFYHQPGFTSVPKRIRASAPTSIGILPVSLRYFSFRMTPKGVIISIRLLSEYWCAGKFLKKFSSFYHLRVDSVLLFPLGLHQSLFACYCFLFTHIWGLLYLCVASIGFNLFKHTPYHSKLEWGDSIPLT